MQKLFDRLEIKSLAMPNRFVRSATWEGLADEAGRVTDRLIDMLVDLARGGVGLIVAGYVYIRQDGKAMVWQTGMYQDELLPDLTRLTKAVHEAGGRIVAQLAHGGVMTEPGLAGIDVPVGPSVVNLPKGSGQSRELSVSEIQDLVDDFGRAAKRASQAGFDAVQLHGAHGYLLSQFLSPYFNHRGDRYGGSALNRARICLEAYEAVRAAVGPDYPVMIKMNSEDFLDGGLELADSLVAASELAALGLDAVEVSGGMLISGRLSPSRIKINSPEKEAYFRTAGGMFKERLDIPVFLVGGNRSLEVMADVLDKGQADGFALSRPFIREPRLVKRWADGDRAPAACVSCNRCFASAFEGRGISCGCLKDGES